MARLDFKTPNKTFKILKKIKGDFEGKLILTDNDGKQYELFSGMVDIDQGQIVDNKPPVVFAGSDITIMPGREVELDGTATDTDGNVVEVIWTQVSGIETGLQVDSLDATNARLTTPEIIEGHDSEQLVYMLQATDDKGAKSTDTMTITITPDGKPIDPNPHNGGGGAKVLWDSKNPEFADGKEERIDVGKENHYMGWKKDGIIASHAGATRKYTKDGKGGFTIDGARARMYPYPDELQEAVRMTSYVTADPGKSLDNITFNSASDHNEGGQPEHRFGGRQGRFGYKDQKVGFKIELYHNVHMTVNDVSLPDGIKLEYGKKQGLRTETWNDKNGQIQLLQFIDQNADGNWVQVNKTTVKNPKPYFLGKKKYGWFRTNNDNGDPKNTLFEDSIVEEIEPPS